VAIVSTAVFVGGQPAVQQGDRVIEPGGTKRHRDGCGAGADRMKG
jgi:hypothetical protein